MDGRAPPLPALDAPAREKLRAQLFQLRPRRVKDLPEGAREAAVLIPLCEVAGAPAVLFTKRSETVGTHKGQVSFPGGMRDDTDRDHVHTALRELEEELGLAPDDVDVLGRFHEARAITGVRVIPVVGWLGTLEIARLVPNPAEIDDVFTLSLAALTDPAHRRVESYGHRGTLPVFEAGPHPVWGLTAWILDTFLREVLLPRE